MAEAETQLRDRLKSIVEQEGSAVVEPSCLSDDSCAPVLENAFRSACEPVKIMSKQDFQKAAPTRAPKGWMLIAAGVAIGLILAVVVFLTCRKRPSTDKRSGRRQARRQSVEEDELEEEEEEEDALPVIAKNKPTPEVRRPAPRRAARSKTETDEEEDPMFQPL